MDVPIVYSDSNYCVQTFNDWMFNWARNGWIKSDKKTPENENELWEYIDKIMELDEYKKSFNKVINKALMYGLPILYNSLFEMEEENKMSVQMIKKINGIDENYYSQITNLIKEVILNVTINKSILCSLYGIKEIETKGGKVDIKKIKKGAYRDTPDYLIDYEINGLNELRK